MMKINYNILVFAIFGCLIQSPALAQKYYNQNETESLNELTKLDSTTHFYVIGDWGRNGYYNGKEVADIMQQAGFIIEPDFIISTGLGASRGLRQVAAIVKVATRWRGHHWPPKAA